MSERTWTHGSNVGSHVTGDLRTGAIVEPALGRNGWYLQVWVNVASREEAQRLASRWLDEIEAEAQMRKPLCMSCASFHGSPSTPGYCSHHSDERAPGDSCAAWRRSDAALEGTPAQVPAPAPEAIALGAMERANLDELAPKFHALKAGETLAVLVTRREDGLAHVVWGPAAPVGTPANSGEPAAKPEPKPAEEIDHAD